MSNTVIKIENLSKIYRLGEVGTGTLSHDLNRWWRMNIRGQEDPYAKIGHVNDRTQKAEKGELVAALRDINLEVKQGEVLGIIGKNGAGKSTLLKLLSRVTSPTTGTIKTKGRMASLLEVGTGFHPEMTGRENIYMNGTIMGMRKWEITDKLDEIVDFAGVAKYLDTPTKRYSSGMTVRLGFAIAAFLEPEILIVDEVLAVGDAEFQKKAIGKMQDVSKGDGRTVLFVSHNMASVQSLCTRGIIIESGFVDYIGEITKCIGEYLQKNNLDLTKRNNLEEIKNRTGNGKVIFSSISIEDENGRVMQSILTGQDVYFSIMLKVAINCTRVNIGLSLHNYLGDVLSVIYSGYQNEYFEFSKEGYYNIRFLLRNFNFSSGSYYIKGRIEVANEESDWPKEVLNKIVVNTGDFYGTGNIGFATKSIVLVKGDWDVAYLSKEKNAKNEF
jgi:lipopolysaccharide transport system ATP-binding protein